MKLLLIILSTLNLQLSTAFADANQLYADGNFADAANAYEAIIAEQPNSEAYYNLGNAYFKQDELAKAILAYERCLRLDPRNKDAKYNLASRLVTVLPTFKSALVMRRLSCGGNSQSVERFTLSTSAPISLNAFSMLPYSVSKSKASVACAMCR